MTKEDWLRLLIHIPAGFITVIGGCLHWVFALCFSLGFIIYELNEDWHLSDKAFKDILGWLVGIGIGITILFILRELWGLGLL